MLHHHHEAEDINLWPRLRERATDQQELLDAMEGQHRGDRPRAGEGRGARGSLGRDGGHRGA